MGYIQLYAVVTLVKNLLGIKTRKVGRTKDVSIKGNLFWKGEESLFRPKEKFQRHWTNEYACEWKGEQSHLYSGSRVREQKRKQKIYSDEGEIA